MAAFEPAFQFMLVNEVGNSRNGGYSNDPVDPGGETKWGISKRAHPNLDVANLTMEQAELIYKDEYWCYDDIFSQQVATKLFDTAVNIGKMKAVEIVQQACGKQIVPPIPVDGLYGTVTKAAINNCNAAQLLSDMRQLQIAYYQGLVRANPKLTKFLVGWCSRAARLPIAQVEAPLNV